MAENWWLIRRQLPGENVSPAIKSAGKWMKNHRIRRLLNQNLRPKPNVSLKQKQEIDG